MGRAAWTVLFPDELELRTWEKALVTLAALLSLSALALFLGNIRFLSVESGAGGSPIGSMASAQGEVRRERAGEDSFGAVGAGEPVFAGDLLVTGPGGTAVVELDGGASLVVEPGSMVRLAFEQGFSLSGIFRFTGGARPVAVDVVTGGVSSKPKPGASRVKLLDRGRPKAASEGQAVSLRVEPLPFIPAPAIPVPEAIPPPVPEAPTAPVAAPERIEAPRVEAPRIAVAAPSALPSLALPGEPSPVAPPAEIRRVRFLEPRPGALLRPRDGAKEPDVQASVMWSAEPAGIPLQISLHRLTRTETGEIQREQLHSETVTSAKSAGRVSRPIAAPGEYEWEIRAQGGESLASAGKTTVPFTVSPEYLGIKLENPLVGGEESASNQLRDRVLRDFDIRLRWKPVPEAEDYEVWIAASSTAKKPLLERKSGGQTSLSLNKGKVLRGRLFYRITARLPSGFIASSPVSPLIFDFLPPTLVGPKEGERVRRAGLEEGALMFTWETTNFTESYLFELSPDSKFASSIERDEVQENFSVRKAPAPGRYFWRVRSLGKGVESAPSAPRAVQID